MRDIRKQLEIIAERANEYLRKWGVDEPISVGEREGNLTSSMRSFWGWGSWETPTYVFRFDGIEVGAYSDKAKAIRVSGEFHILGRPYSMRCKHTRSNASLPYPIDFFLALSAFCHYLIIKHEHVISTFIGVGGSGQVSLEVRKPTIRIDFQGDKAILRGRDYHNEFYQEGTVDDILVQLNKTFALTNL